MILFNRSNDFHNCKIGLKDAKRYIDEIRLRLVYKGKMPFDKLAELCERNLLDEGITRIGKHKIGCGITK